MTPTRFHVGVSSYSCSSQGWPFHIWNTDSLVLFYLFHMPQFGASRCATEIIAALMSASMHFGVAGLFDFAGLFTIVCPWKLILNKGNSGERWGDVSTLKHLVLTFCKTGNRKQIKLQLSNQTTVMVFFLLSSLKLRIQKVCHEKNRLVIKS